MSDTMISLLLPPLLLVPAMGLLSRAGGSGAIASELRRKSLHVGVGLTALAFPLYLDSTPRVLTALALVLAWMLAVRKVAPLRARFGRCLFDTGRRSHGELYFAAATALLLVVADTPMLYAIPMLVLTLADAAAAIVGRLAARAGLAGRSTPHGKTAAGTAAFIVVAFVSAALPLALGTATGLAATLVISAATAVLTAVVERASRGGADNFLIPVTAYVVLRIAGLVGEAGTADAFANLIKPVTGG